MSTKKWDERFSQPKWPTVMRTGQFPFLAALDFPGFDETRIQNLAGAVESVKIDIFQTPYNNFLLLWVPQRRLRRPKRVHVTHD
jgi:hypothetical protein